jgi:hypothetical protein
VHLHIPIPNVCRTTIGYITYHIEKILTNINTVDAGENMNMNAVGGGNLAHLILGTEDKAAMSLGFSIYMSLSCPEEERRARDGWFSETHLQQGDLELCTCRNFLITKFLITECLIRKFQITKFIK